MFVSFFQELKQAGVPVTLREYLTLLEAMDADLASRRVDDFYYLSRAALVKDERNIDKFDRVFGHVFKGLETIDGVIEADIPAEWLKKLAEKYLTEEEKKQIEAMGGLDKLLETLRKRLAEQKKRHQGGSKWIGTAGTSPYGAYGYNPEGVRIGQDENRNFRAVKVWDKREFKDLDDEVEIGTRNIKLALRRLRKFARTGAPGGARSRRHHQGHRAQRLSGYSDAAGTAQCREGAPVLRHRRLDGLAHQGDRGIVFGGAQRVQTPSVFLLPQLPVRARVEGKPPPVSRRRRRPGTCCTLIRTTTR